MKRLPLALAVLSFAVFPSLSLAGDAGARVNEARRLARTGSVDFAFMEYQAALRDDPNPAQAREAAFAVGEYHFKRNNPAASAPAFERVAADPKAGTHGLMALVHLAKLSRPAGGPGAEAADARVKEALSGRKLVLVFEERKVKKWTSPLGTRFQIREYVDRLEVLENDRVFYEVELP